MDILLVDIYEHLGAFRISVTTHIFPALINIYSDSRTLLRILNAVIGGVFLFLLGYLVYTIVTRERNKRLL